MYESTGANVTACLMDAAEPSTQNGFVVGTVRSGPQDERCRLLL